MSAPLGLVISQLYNIIGNYAITLIVITVVIKVLLYPLYKKQIMSMASMGDLQPLMKDIQNKYANDPVLMREKIFSFSGRVEPPQTVLAGSMSFRIR